MLSPMSDLFNFTYALESLDSHNTTRVTQQNNFTKLNSTTPTIDLGRISGNLAGGTIHLTVETSKKF